MKRKNWFFVVTCSLILVFLTTATVLAAAPSTSSVEVKKTPSLTKPTKLPKTTGNENSAANKNKVKTVKTVNYRGYVVSASDSSITISLDDGSLVTFNITTDTKAQIPTTSRTAVMTDFKVNYYVVIHAKLDTATQTLTATGINMVPGQTDKAVNGAGTVTDYQPGVSITVTDVNGEPVTYLLTENTQIVSDDPTLTITAGSTVVVLFTTDPVTGEMTAKCIVISSPEALQTTVTATAEPTEAPEATEVPEE